MSGGSPIVACSRVVDIASGELHSLSLLDDGRGFACGAYDSGQLGFGPGHILASVNKVYYPWQTPEGVWPGRNPTCSFGVWEMSAGWGLVLTSTKSSSPR